MIEKSQTQSLKGFCILIIVIGHLCAAYNATLCVNILRIVLPSSVAFFMFSTGYGICIQYEKKGTEYFKSFVKNKIIGKLVVPFIFAIILCIFIKYIFGLSYNVDYARGETFLPNGWYIRFIIGAYFVIYIAFKYLGKNSKCYAQTAVFICSGLYMLWCIRHGWDSTWYANVPALLFGIIGGDCPKTKMNFHQN